MMIAGAPSASAGATAVRYVDAQTGADTGTCTLAAPCQTIAYAIANSGSGDVIHVDNGTYAEQVTLGDTKSLEFDNFVAADGTGAAIVDGSTGTGITVPASGAGHIRGLTIRGNASGLLLQGTAEVDHNTFDDPDATSGADIDTTTFADVGSIHENTFTDATPSPTRSRGGISLNYGQASVLDNHMSGLMVGINASAPLSGSQLIAGNEITGTHNAGVAGRAISVGGGGGPGNTGTVVLRGNRISGGSDAIGISLAVPATLVRNAVDGMQTGVLVNGDTPGVAMEGDRVWNSSNADLQLLDLNATAPRTSVTATNLTLVQGSVAVDSSDLTLDSSIIETIGAGGSATCAITFSRGDTSGSDPSGCDNFSTTADPQFVDSATGNFHLSTGSPMIDAGNPAAPDVGAVDFDGEARALDGTPECSGDTPRRDIGADEFSPAFIDCDPPETMFTKTPPKKTKKGRVTFEFDSDEPAGGQFMCRLDGADYASCDSPIKVRVGIGRHTFRVFAIDAAANEDASAAKYSFKRLRRH